MKRNPLPLLLLTFFFFLGNLWTVSSVAALEEAVDETVIGLEAINLFEDQESEPMDADWERIALQLAKVQESFNAITHAETDQGEPSTLSEQSTDLQEIKLQETELEDTEPETIKPNEVQPQEVSDDGSESDTQGEGEKVSESVELNGDTVEYSIDGNQVIAQGNVVVINKDMRLTCDRIDFSRDTDMAYATGNVRLVMKSGEASEMTGEKLTFNFKTMQGSFDGAKIYAKPYYGYGGKVHKVGENHMQMENNFITTCDLDKPHYRMTSKKMDMYPGEKLVARSIRMLIGNIPILYMPRFTQDLSRKEPRVTFTPGYDKDWGMFVLSNWRYGTSDNFKGIIHLDLRERKDFAWGIDLDYKTPKVGKGRVRTYYMNERSITSDRFYQERPSPTIERERFGIEWRHKWKVDKKTEAILQYSKQSDSTFLKDYFERRSEEDATPETFFLLTRTLPGGSLSFRSDVRVNRFESKVERLPEIRYDLSNQEIFNSGFYLRNTTTYSNLTNKNASPSEVRTNTMRVDTDSEVSYPMKVGILEFKPFVGGRNTYYSKTKDPDKYGSIRGIFTTGASLSTRFYRVFDVELEEFGLDINRLRHIITPSVNYRYSTLPTRTSDQLDIFDSIDSLDKAHAINFSIENKLQTKRNEESVELLRAIVGTDFRLKEDSSKGGFDQVTADIDFKPTDWLTFYHDSSYDTQREHLATSNFDMYINNGEKWSLGVGKRWNREVDDQLTAGFNYKINPLWKFRTYTRFDLDTGVLKEQEYGVTRDLHAWTMDINFNETRLEGNEIWVVFTLKAFPDMVIDFGTSYNKRRAGSQN